MSDDKKSLLELRTAVNRVVTGKSGLIEGSRQVQSALVRLGQSMKVEHKAITAPLANLPPELPTGDSLLYISDTTYLAATQELSEIESRYRVAIQLECRAIYNRCRKALDEIE